MKKFLVGLVLASVATAGFAQHHHGYYGGRGNWVAPFVAGGLVTYALTQPQRTVIIQQPPTVVYYNTPQQPPYGYHYENLLDANCGCYKLVLVQN
jgi:hypothetical protein